MRQDLIVENVDNSGRPLSHDYEIDNFGEGQITVKGQTIITV